ncbi:hypothetical protein [Streptomyces sp. NPDC059863]|uniref:hypothetical protein n=1 Tax=unclassified Streptomyces TaxID=2593676 RepID=UPI0036491227
MQVGALITAVEVQPGIPTRAIAMTGDSRVDGIGSTPGADRRWTEAASRRSVTPVHTQALRAHRRP